MSLLPDLLVPRLPPAPYPGLRPYEKSEWPIFVGREKMTTEVAGLLLGRGLVFVHGPSGSGKSSLVRAGVQASLEQKHARSDLRWRTCAMRPGNSPLRNLSQALCSVATDQTPDRQIRIHRLLNHGKGALNSLADTIGLESVDRVCVLLDQFEEIFLAGKERRAEADLLIDFLADFLEKPPAQFYVLVTMRSEFLGECSKYDRLSEVINKTQYLLPRMELSDLLRAIREPAELYDWTITRRLAERMVAETRSGADELPLVQHGLARLWQTTSNDNPRLTRRRVLDLSDYEGRGPLGRLLSDHADEVANDFPNVIASSLEELFRALTDVNAEGNAIRRPQRFDQLLALARCSEEQLRRIIDRFRQPGVSFLTPLFPAPIEMETTIDVSHEALIRQWGAISNPSSGWLQREFRDGLIWRSLVVQAESFAADRKNFLSEATSEARSSWIEGRSESWSLRYGGQWPRVIELLKASRSEAERRKQEAEKQHEDVQRLRNRSIYLMWTGAAALLLLATVGFSIFLLTEAMNARDSATRALNALEIQAAAANFSLNERAKAEVQLRDALEVEKRTTADLQAALQQLKSTQTSSAGIVAQAYSERGDAAVERILETMRASADPIQVSILAQSVTALGVPLSEMQIEFITRSLLFALSAAANQSENTAAGQALVAVARVLPSPIAAAEMSGRLRAELAQTDDISKKISIAGALQAIAGRWPEIVSGIMIEEIAKHLALGADAFASDEAQQVARILVDLAANSRDTGALMSIATALRLVSSRLAPGAAAELLARLESIRRSNGAASGISELTDVMNAIQDKSRTLETVDLLVCVGDRVNRAACPNTAQFISCGANVQVWAANQCSTFRISRLVDVPGGACGYALYQVNCTRQVSKALSGR